ncbi:hypothetical protein BDY21DRAFT_331972 [Lineolata rhizophorae]|uniref:Uncharacterized protein n=1 Tax=Lineolata rhizophorae TaxID=578093 RepID=A0A6A6PBN2_9PEZI|nr:hypothetical protein BDY21DRAFT_331972 [Lineolata rhizophorae]
MASYHLPTNTLPWQLLRPLPKEIRQTPYKERKRLVSAAHSAGPTFGEPLDTTSSGIRVPREGGSDDGRYGIAADPTASMTASLSLHGDDSPAQRLCRSPRLPAQADTAVVATEFAGQALLK